MKELLRKYKDLRKAFFLLEGVTEIHEFKNEIDQGLVLAYNEFIEDLEMKIETNKIRNLRYVKLAAMKIKEHSTPNSKMFDIPIDIIEHLLIEGMNLTNK